MLKHAKPLGLNALTVSREVSGHAHITTRYLPQCKSDEYSNSLFGPLE